MSRDLITLQQIKFLKFLRWKVPTIFAKDGRSEEGYAVFKFTFFIFLF